MRRRLQVSSPDLGMSKLRRRRTFPATLTPPPSASAASLVPRRLRAEKRSLSQSSGLLSGSGCGDSSVTGIAEDWP